MDIRDYLKQHIVLLDGAMGTMLQKQGAEPGEYTEKWNVAQPEKVINVHQSYFDAGSNIVITNTFGAHALHFEKSEREEIIEAGIQNAQEARKRSSSQQDKFVAFDIGPLGKLLQPFGDLDFEEAVDLFAEMVSNAVKHSPDLIMIETMSDSYETKVF